MEQNIILLFFLILLSGFFSGAEVALISVTTIRARTYLKEKRKGSAALSRLKSNPRRMIITILIGNNVVNISAASISAYLASKHFGSTGLGIITGILTLVILIFGEITPKTFASRYAGKISLLIAKPIEIMEKILFPLVYLLEKLTKLLEGVVSLKAHAPITEADIKTMIEYGVEEKVVAPEEQLIINRALAFSDLIAKSVMIPIRDVFSLEQNEKISESLDKMIQSGYTRIPLYDGDKSNIVGISMVKDVARALITNNGFKKLKDILVAPITVPENIRIDYLFKIFQKQHKHMAIVYDSHKVAIGIVTLEDLIEELVGEIIDESDISK